MRRNSRNPNIGIDDGANAQNGHDAMSQAGSRVPVSHGTDDADRGGNSKNDVPTKIIGKKTMIQFTCGFKELNLGGRSDLRAIKTIVSKLAPQRVALLRGSGNASTEEIQSASKALCDSGVEAWAPELMETLKITATTEKVKLLIPQILMSGSALNVNEVNDAVDRDQSSHCSVVVLPPDWKYFEVRNKSSDGIRAAKVLPKSSYEAPVEATQRLSTVGASPGAVSVGEVLLETLKQRLENNGVSVQYMLGRRGGMLLCDNAVVIRKENENDFIIEGSSCRALTAARKALYDCYTFL